MIAESSENHPLRFEIHSDLTIHVQIEDRFLEFNSWSEFKRRVRNKREEDYSEISEEGQAVFDFLEKCIEKYNERMEIIESI